MSSLLDPRTPRFWILFFWYLSLFQIFGCPLQPEFKIVYNVFTVTYVFCFHRQLFGQPTGWNNFEYRLFRVLDRWNKCCGSLPLTYGSGSGSGSCIFRQFFCWLRFEGTFTSLFKDKKRKRSKKNSRDQDLLLFSLLVDGRIRIRSCTYNDWSGYGRPKNIQFRIRIHN